MPNKPFNQELTNSYLNALAEDLKYVGTVITNHPNNLDTEKYHLLSCMQDMERHIKQIKKQFENL